MNCYQKFYTNQIHSSSLLCQLATMWKSQVLCDAIIRSGSVITKAHRVVLVAACPMLQSMENAAVGSHLEVRLASDIKQESVQMFLQYLYEGFMMLTEQNCRDVEKIARLLQVDSIIKCCADFNKCLASKTGNMSATDQYKYTFHDMVEFKHVRSSDLQKTMQDRMVKRGSEFSHPSSPSTKRSRTQEVMDDTVTGCYGNVAPDPWDRVPRLGMPSHSRGGSTSQPGVVDIVGDGIELIQTDPPDSNAGNRQSDRRISQKTVSIAVASQINSTTDLQVVDVAEKSKTESRSGNTSTLTSHGRVNTADPSPSSVPETSKSSNSYNSSSSFSKQISPSFPSVSTDKFHMGSPPVLSPTHAQISSRSSPQFASTSSKSDAGPKPFAAGSESQSTVPQQSSYSGEYSEKNSSEPSPDTGPKEISDTSQQRPSRTASASSKQEADIAIVKIESEDEDDTGGLEMYVNMPDGGEIRVQRTEHDEEGDPQAEWGREENEDSNVSGDQNNSWLFAQSQFKGMYSGQEQWMGHGTGSGCDDPSSLLALRNIASNFVIHNLCVPHRAVSIHMQRTCFVCKHFGRRIQSQTSNQMNKMNRICRSSFKCECCNISLCVGDRKCFQQFHEMLRATQYPNLVWEHPYRHPLLPPQFDLKSSFNDHLNSSL